MKSKILKKFENKLALAVSEKLYDDDHGIQGINLNFTSVELQEHAEKTPGKWQILHEYPNRQERRSTLSKRNLKRYQQTQKYREVDMMKTIHEMDKLKKEKIEVQDLINNALK